MVMIINAIEEKLETMAADIVIYQNQIKGLENRLKEAEEEIERLNKVRGLTNGV